MTEKLYYRDAYATKFTARVLDCTEEKKHWTVILNRTLFYPEGGGQPADIGVLGGVRVLDVHERGEDIVHTTDKPLPVGAEVEGEIDWEHRFDLMQNHSGEHILSGVICGRYGCDNVGFHMGKESITIDLNTKIPAEDLPYLEEKANEAIWKNVPVGIRYPSKEELAKLEYRSKKELEGQVRIVNVGEYDCCACCGTHVKLAGEIGQIKIIGAQNYKGGTRLELLCGKRGTILHYVENNQAVADGELILIDAGAQWQWYNGDISRTFPVNGKFTERQKLVYNIVLEGQRRVIDAIRPGVQFSSLNELLKEYYFTALKEIGLVETREDVAKYYYHGVSHYLGAETHDIGRYGDRVLEPGMVLTVEPGLYIEEWEIGIRIEDDVLVTAEGNEVMTAAMLKTVDEIEAFMAKE